MSSLLSSESLNVVACLCLAARFTV